MENLSKKQIIIIGIIVVVIAIVVIYYFFNNIQQINYDYLDNMDNEEFEENNSDLNITEEEEQTIIVHIAGAVSKEGIVTLNEGDRIIDAINEAGGLKEDADLSNVNLAYVLSDGQKIRIPFIGEEKDNNSGSEESIIVDSLNGNSQSSSLVNINTATLTQLLELPRNRRANSSKNNKL